MILLSSFFSGLFLILTAVFIAYFVGFFSKTKTQGSISKALLLGLILLTVFFSLFKTSLQSINLLCIPLLLIYLSPYFKSDISTTSLKEIIPIKKKIIYIIIVHMLSFLYFNILYFDFDLFQIKFNWYDTCYYSNLSRGVDKTGLENKSSIFYQFNNIKQLIPYHYFDIWLNIIVTKISGLNYYTSLVLVTYPVLLSTFFLTIIDKFNKNKIHVLIAAVLLPLVVNNPLLTNSGFFSNYGLLLNILSITNSKILINYILILAIAFALLNRKIKEFLIFSFFLMIFYSTTIISVIPSTGAILLILLTKRKFFKISKSELKSFLIIYSFFFTALVLFLFLSAEKNIVANNDSRWVTASFKTASIVFIEYMIKYSISYIFSIIICFYTIYIAYSKKLLQVNIGYILVIIYFVLIAISSILFSSILHGTNVDFPQSISNVLVCCFTALSVISFYTLTIKLNYNPTKLFYVVVIGLTTINIYKCIDHSSYYPYKYSNKFTSNVLESFKQKKAPKYISVSKGDNETNNCSSEGSIPKETDFSKRCYIFNRTNAFLCLADNISLGIDIKYDKILINKIDEFKESLKVEKITHVFTSKDVFLNIPHKKLIVDSITKQKVYIL